MHDCEPQSLGFRKNLLEEETFKQNLQPRVGGSKAGEVRERERFRSRACWRRDGGGGRW